jgi:uncharacterized protein YceK
MKKLIGVLIVIVMLAGCATTQMIASKSDMAQFQRDNYECMQQSRTSAGGGGSGLIGLAMIAAAQAHAQSQANIMFKMCMEARGYVITVREIEQPVQQFERKER